MIIKVTLSRFIKYDRSSSYELNICEVKHDETGIWEEDILKKVLKNKKEVIDEIKNTTSLSETDIKKLGVNFKNSTSVLTIEVDNIYK